MLESTVEAALVARIEALGGETRKVKWLDRNGAPDRLVMLPAVEAEYAPPYYRTVEKSARRSRTIWVELKAPGAKPRPTQVREHARLRALGQIVLVIDTIEAIDKLFPLKP